MVCLIWLLFVCVDVERGTGQAWKQGRTFPFLTARVCLFFSVVQQGGFSQIAPLNNEQRLCHSCKIHFLVNNSTVTVLSDTYGRRQCGRRCRGLAWLQLLPFLVRLLLIRQRSRRRRRRQVGALADLRVVEGHGLGEVRESEKQVEKCDSLLNYFLYCVYSVHEEYE